MSDIQIMPFRVETLKQRAVVPCLVYCIDQDRGDLYIVPDPPAASQVADPLPFAVTIPIDDS